MKKLVSVLILLIFSVSLMTFTAKTQELQSITINSDGSITPPDAPIFTVDNITYTLTGDINGFMTIQRDNIVVDGAHHNLRFGEMILIERSNVTVKHFTMVNTSSQNIYDFGIHLANSSNCMIVENNITPSDGSNGIEIYGSSNNSIIRNTIAPPGGTIFGTGGIGLFDSKYNLIVENTIKGNVFSLFGIAVAKSEDNRIYHNNIVDNELQVWWISSSSDIWDNGYPSGGNYWSQWGAPGGPDLFSGPFQNETGSDGIRDYLLYLGMGNVDQYPLMKPYPWDQYDLGITDVSVSEIDVIQGSELDLNVTVFNYGNYTEDFDVTIYANSTFIQTHNATLTTRNSTAVAFTWNTTGFATGRYAILANATILSGEASVEDNSFTYRWVVISIPGDLNSDKTVDIFDAVMLSNAFDNPPSDPGWNPDADINDDDVVDILDAIILANHFGEMWA